MADAKKLHTKKPKCEKKGYNEASLKNLQPFTSSEEAREKQKASVVARKRNAEMRAKLKDMVGDLKKFEDELKGEMPSALKMMQLCMIQAAEAEDWDRVAQFAEKIAPYEQPKLAAQTLEVTTIDKKDLTDEELAEEAKKLGIDPSVLMDTPNSSH